MVFDDGPVFVEFARIPAKRMVQAAYGMRVEISGQFRRYPSL